MKKLLPFLFLIPTLTFAQKWNSVEMRYKHSSQNKPHWVQLMYGEQPDPDKVTKAYHAYYSTHPFIKNSDTQYYKRWMRSFSRDNAQFLIDDTRKSQLKKLEEKYVRNTLQNSHSKAPTSQWSGIGPIDFDKGAASRSYAAGAGHVYTTEQSLTNDSVLYCGTATAGVWKTTNKGENWFPVTNHLPINEVIALEIDPTDSDIVYFGAAGSVYKTTDGGTSWVQIGGTQFNTEEHSIPEIRIHPTNNQLVFVCSDNGFFRSTDGGTNFTEIMDGDFQEMEFHPTQPNTCYIINQINDETEFYKSTDAGASLVKKTIGWPVPAPNDEQKRTEIATTPAAPHKIYALCTGEANGGSGLYGIYISNDMGESWSRTCCGPQVGGVPSLTNQNLMAWEDDGTDDGGQFYYDLALEVSDTDSNHVFVGAVNLWISTDGGNTFTCPSKWSHSYKTNYVHADIHDLKFFGNDFWLSCDGGLFYSNNSATTIDKKMVGIEATDFWGFGAGFWDGEVMLGGTYHNGTLLKDNNVYLNGWVSTAGGDNVRGFVNPGDERKIIHDFGEFELSGNRNQAFTPLNFSILPNATYIIGASNNIAYHPQSHNTAYVGENGSLWVTDDDGDFFDLVHDFGNADVASVEIAPEDPSTIYVSLYTGWWDRKELWKTNDGGANWTEITPVGSTIGNADEWIPYDITVDSKDPNTLWIARTSMYGGYPNYDGLQVLKSTDGGTTWNNYSTPTLDGEYPTNIVHQRGTDGGVYLGTRRGVYYRNNSLSDWQLFNNNLPVSTMSIQLIPYYREGKIRNGTNRSVYECELYENGKPHAQIGTEYKKTYCPNEDVQFHNRSAVNETGASYQWIFEGGTPATSADRHPLVTYSTFGEFDVTLIVSDTFGIDTQYLKDFVYVDNCFGWDTVNTSVATEVEKVLDIYPTVVTNNIVQVKNTLNQKLIYRMYNAEGKLVDADDVEGNVIPTKNLKKGSYFIRLIGEKNMVHKTIFIQ